MTELSAKTVLEVATTADESGFTLARLQEIAGRKGLRLQAAVRSPGALWATPALVHWKEDLWRTVLAPEGLGFWVADPTRGQIWMDASVLEEESSGFCLIPPDVLPAGWRPATQAEASTVVGRSYSDLPGDAYDENCEPPCCPPGHGGFGAGDLPGLGGLGGLAGLGGLGGMVGLGGLGAMAGLVGFDGDMVGGDVHLLSVSCSSCPKGLPQWRISEPFINVWLGDEPWGYTSAWGPPVRLGMTYKLRDGTPLAPDVCDPWEAAQCEFDWILYDYLPVAGTSFGVGWTSRWFSYVHQFEVGDPNTGSPDHLAVRTPGRGLVEVYLSPNDEQTDPDFATQGVVSRLRDAQQDQMGWQVTYPDGATYEYALEVPGSFYFTEPILFFLTRHLDASGQALEFTYDAQEVTCGGWFDQQRVRLTQIEDAAGETSTLTYGNGTYPTLVTSIADPYSRTAYFSYDGDGYLTNITDVAGIQASFDYAAPAQGYPPWLSQLTTPYGTTTFMVTDFAVDSNLPYTRGVVVLLPDGTRQAALYVEDDAQGTLLQSTGFSPYYDPDTIPDNLPIQDSLGYEYYGGYYTDRAGLNTFYWDTAQAGELSTTNLAQLDADDLLLGRIRHWLVTPGSHPDLGRSLSWERDASPDGVTEGAMTWYGYEDKDAWDREGSSLLPSLIAKVMPDSTTWWQWYQRNSLGRPTQIVERWIDPWSQAHLRTNRFEYAANDIDLVAHFGPGDELQAGFTYDAGLPHVPVAMTNALGEVTRFFFDSQARLLGLSEPSGHAVTNSYNAAGYLQTQIDLISTTPVRTNSYTWLNGYPRTQTDPRGFTKTFTYDGLGRPTRIDYPDSTYEQFAYTNGVGTAILDRTAHRDRLGNWTYTSYTPARKPSVIIDPLGHQTVYTWCDCGGPDSVTRAYGTGVAETTSYDYDLLGRLLRTDFADGGWQTNSYDARHRLVSRTTLWGSKTNVHDNLNRPVAVYGAVGLTDARDYDDYDRLLWQTDARTNTVSFDYDLLGRLSERTVEADSSTESWGYTSGQAAATAFTNAVGNVTLWAYDGLGRKTNEVQVGVWTNSFTWTPSGDLATLADGKGNVTSWQYDTEGRVSEKWYQGQSTADLLYLYDANGQLTDRFTRTGTGVSTNGFWTTYAYDAAGQMTNVIYPAGTTSVSLTYDALGRLTQRVDGIGSSSYSYAMSGSGVRTMTEDGPWSTDAVTVTNKFGLPVGLNVAQPSGQWWQAWDYDSAGRWQTAASPAGTFTYHYPGDATPEPIGLDLPGGNWITNRYDARGRLTETALRGSGGTLLNLHGYDYNDASQRTWLSRTNSAVPAWSGHIDTAYDAAGQLTKAWSYYTNGNPVTSEQWGYLYDAAQNLNQRTNYLTVEAFSVNALNELTSIPGSTPTYDRRGNLIQRGFTGSYQWYYTYDHENRLTEVRTDTYYTSESNRFKEQLVYDGLGRLRIRRNYIWSGGNWSQNGETRYLYAGWLQVQERDGSNVPTVSYTRGRDLSGSLQGAGGIGGLLARSHGYSGGSWSSHVAYHADGNGNITALVDSNGALQGSYRYDRFGRYRGYYGALAGANAMRFSSKLWVGFKNNAVNGLYYYGYRLYDPYLQRWVNRDPIAELGGINLYAFLENSPTARIDMYGNKWWEWIPGLSTGIHAYQRLFGHVPGIGPEDYAKCLGLSGMECSLCVRQLLSDYYTDYTGWSIGSDIMHGFFGGTTTLVGVKLGQLGLRGGALGVVSGGLMLADAAVDAGIVFDTIFDMREAAKNANEKYCDCD